MIPVLIVLGVLVLLVVIVGAWGAGIYNSLVELRNRFKNAFSQIDVQLKRRYDLIPNLVEVAKGYLKHERETLEAVIKAEIGKDDGHELPDIPNVTWGLDRIDL